MSLTQHWPLFDLHVRTPRLELRYPTDDEVADYVHQLEEARDTVDLPEASGEAIAREFERYLKRRTDDT